MKHIKSHFRFTKGQRNGIFLLVLIIIVIQVVYMFVEFPSKEITSNKTELAKFQNEIDSLKLVEVENNKPKIFPFNPNYITDYKGYTLGMSSEEIDRLLHYREQDKWINSTKQFQQVTKVSDSLLAEISPYFKFPEWVTNRKKSGKNYVNKYGKELDFSEKKDLNTATATQLEEIYGVGKTLSKRIVAYRNKIGGFATEEHLFEVYGLKEEVIERIKDRFAVKTKIDNVKMNINEVSASDIATIPGISFEKAKKIWEFVRVREGLENLSELEKIEGISARELRLIRLYLSTE